MLRPAKLWNDTESAPDCAALLLPRSRAARQAWATAVRQRPGAGVHHHQAALAAPVRAGRVGRAGFGPPPARLVDLPADRSAGHRPRGRVGHRLLVAGARTAIACDVLDRVLGDRDWLAALPEVLDPRGRGGRVARHRGSRRRGDRRQHGGRAGIRPPTGRSGLEPRHQWDGLRRSAQQPSADPTRHRGRLCRRDRPLPAAGLHDERDEGDRCGHAPARRRPRPVRSRWPSRQPPGADGMVLVPHFDGERTPNRPDATGVLAGLRSDVTPAQMARAAVEGVVCNLLEAAERLPGATVPSPDLPHRGRGSKRGLPAGGGRPDRKAGPRPIRRRARRRRRRAPGRRRLGRARVRGDR